jgi:polyhydroxyalkanoate synthase
MMADDTALHFLPGRPAETGSTTLEDVGVDIVLDAEDRIDSEIRAAIARYTSGISPFAAFSAWADWAYHLAVSPARATTLMAHVAENAMKVAAFAASAPFQPEIVPPFEAAPEDRRFKAAEWTLPPYSAIVQGQLAAEEWWAKATAPMRGVEAHHLRQVQFMGRQALNAACPANNPLFNPVVTAATRAQYGANLLDGARNFWDDVARGLSAGASDVHEVGKTLAITPGRVIFRNELMELIQYAPTTATVHREPVLIVPAWIMKYYILDLTPEHSLIRHLVAQGFTVFCVSWRNPGAESAALSLDDYRKSGVMAAVDAVSEIMPNTRIHAAGYCLGGTVLAIAAAAMEDAGDERLASLSLLAAQTDFTDAGELMLFIDESQVALLEDLMNAQGFLDARQMSGAFYALRANEMLWSRIVERYMLGVRRDETDLEVWLADATRMPARMHSDYLRDLFLENRFAQGKLMVDEQTAAIRDISAPIFAVGAERDHIAPWRSVYKIALFAHAETTFVLTGGGHNTGIVSPPDKPGAYYRLHRAGSCGDYDGPDEWLKAEAPRDGGWWPEWTAWLAAKSSGRKEPPPMGASGAYAARDAAPGTYVYGR